MNKRYVCTCQVFDECHAVKKDHPYAKIMQQYKAREGMMPTSIPGSTTVPSLPIILGFSASPVGHVDKVSKRGGGVSFSVDVALC